MTNRYIPEDVCQKALETWGKERQMWQLMEEMAELQKEVVKNVNRRKDNLTDLTEEAADVMIMMEQLLYIYGIEDAVKKQAEFKVARLKKNWE